MLNSKQLPSKSLGPKAPPVAPGAYPARLVGVVLQGVQKQREFKGEEKPPVLEMRVTYELLDEFMPDDDGNPDLKRPRWLSETFAFHSLKSEKAKSTKRYYAIDPQDTADGDWGKLVSYPCIVTVVNEKSKKDPSIIYDKIGDVTAMRARDAMNAPDLVNPSFVFDFYNPDMEVFNNFPEWIQEKIKSAVDYDGSPLQAALEGKTVMKHKAAPAEKKEKEEESW